MHRTRALLNTVLSAISYRNGGNLVLNAGVPFRRLAVAAADAPGHSAEDADKIKKQEAVDATGAPLGQPSFERRPLRFGTLQFLLQRRMPINSIRLLTNGIRLACDERCADDMVPYLGPWLAQLTRPETLERVMPWSICDILRDLSRLSRIVGLTTVRDALPPKHLQTLANRLVVQGFDKLTPMQLARAADAFAALRPWVRGVQLDHAALDAGNEESAPPVAEVWPSSDWVDELIDWLHNLKPDNEPWPRTSCYALSVILMGLARSNYKPRQPTFQAAAVSMKAKLEEQLKTAYVSRRALSNAAIAWNIWHVNPDEYAPGYWDVYFKSAAQVLEEYVDTAPDPPSVEDDLGPEPADDEEGEKGKRRHQIPRNSPTLLTKRRELRALLSTLALATKNFNLSKQFNEHVKNIWEKRLEEHATYLSGITARRIINSLDGLDVSIKPQTREKLSAISSRYGGKRQSAPREERDIDDFDDLRGSSRAERGAPANRGAAAPSRDRATRESTFDDYDDFQPDNEFGKAPKGGRGGARPRRDDTGFDDKQF